MARPQRAYRARWLLLPAFAFSTITQAAIVVGYEVTRPIPQPVLTIHLNGDGDGQVLVTRAGDSAPLLRCAQERCTVEVPPGTKLELAAVLGDKATFAGYAPFPMRVPIELRPLLGDPVHECMDRDVLANPGIDVLRCPLIVSQDTEVSAEFGIVPEEMKADIIPTPPPVIGDLIKPIAPKEAPPPSPIEAEKLEEIPPVIAMLKPPKPLTPPPPIPPPPPPPPEAKKPPPPPLQPPPNMVAVEVKDDKHVVDKAPDDAKQLSDKNRDVDKETRAKETNLDKESEGNQVASRESDDHTSKDVGGPDDKIRQNEDTKPTTDDHVKESDHSGKDEVAKGVVKGDGGENGDDGTGEKEKGLLAMRGIGGRGSITDQKDKDGRKIGKHGVPGINTPLQNNDYERLMGKDKVEEERQIAARRMGSRKGRWEKKIDAIKSSLENFVPDVQTGNQTALKTRASPYAVYIARMHRHIHELWGFGFLEQLDSKGADDPLNNQDLWVNLEISVNKDGTLHKVTVAKTSGKTEFDVAAVDSVISAGPFEETPEAIRSVDGRIYLRWGFYRNWRQCGTFNAEPYILTSVPQGNDVGVLDGPDSAVGGKMPKITPHHHPIGEGTVTPDDGKAKDKVSPDSTVKDKEAVFAANQWITGFATAQVDKLVKLSTTPFYANGKVSAETPGDLKEMYGNLIVESGAMKDWKLLAPGEYGGGSALPAGNVVVQVRTEKSAFAIVLTKTPSGAYRATQLAR